MRLFIPDIGTELVLTKPWTFRLHHEHRNESLGLALGLAHEIPGSYYNRVQWVSTGKGSPWHQSLPYDEVTLPEGTVLVVDRVYIRKGNEQYSSLSFRVGAGKSSPFPNKKRPRFWAKLADVNTIECDITSDATLTNTV